MVRYASTLCVSSLLLLIGCQANIVDEGEDMVAEVGDAVGEAGCATVTADDDIYSNYCGAQSSVSSDASYDHGANCPTQYVVEFDGNVPNITGWGHGWGDTLPSTQSACEKAKYSIGAYYYNSGVWTNDVATTITGVWSGGACTFAETTDLPTETATLWRVAVKAWQCESTSCLFPTTKKARAYAYGTACF